MGNQTDDRWIDHADGLADLASALVDVNELALDTESNSMFVYRERLCLVQLGLPKAPMCLVAIDPLAFDSPGEALSPFLEWLALGHRVLLHGGEYDVAVMKRELGVAPKNLFDTQAAAAMLGMARTGYANLCEELLGVHVSKEHQQFDWGRRPVPPGPRRYALDDVRHLPALAAIIEERVRKADLEEEVAIACQAVADAAPHSGMNEVERFWRVVGGQRLPPETLARLSALVLWREQQAIARNQPPGRLVCKESLLRLAQHAPTTPNELERFGLSRRLLAEALPSLLEALLAPGAIPEKPRRPPNDPAVEARKSRLKHWREAEALRRGVSLQAVLPSRALEALAHEGPAVDLATVPQLGAKRLRRYGAQLTPLLG